MFIHYKTQALILKKEDRQEADQLFTVYTKDYGKLEILGKAIRKIKSKLRAGADLFYLSDIEFIQGKTYKTLTDAILIEKFPQIRGELIKLTIANKIAETLDNLTAAEEKDERIWSLILKTFRILEDNQLLTKNFQLIFPYFFWKLLIFLGYKPELYHCSVCQEKLIPDLLLFNPQEGGIVCYNCLKKTKTGEKITPETIKILRFIMAEGWQEISRLKILDKDLKSLKEISDSYLAFLGSKTISDS
jgi:DNA repair protein RecO (recombination protein O)